MLTRLHAWIETMFMRLHAWIERAYTHAYTPEYMNRGNAHALTRERAYTPE